MMRLLLASLTLLLAHPVGARAAAPTRADVRHKLDRFVLEARARKTVRDWIAHARLFSRLDREALLSAPELPEQMPAILRRFNDRELTVVVDGLTADFQNIHRGELTLNGEKIFFRERVDLAGAYRIIDRHLRRQSSRAWSRWLSPPLAEAEAVRPTCISSKYELMFRSPAALLESNFGYAGRLFAASLVVSTLNIAAAAFTNCDAQIADLRKLLEQGKLGIKAIDCGSDASGSDRSVEFWIPELNEKGEPGTRAFNLDYTLLVAQDSLKEEEDEEKAKAARRKEPALYIFGTTELQEVRVRKIDERKNGYYCESALPSTEKFAKFRDEIEPYRKVFEYLGNYNGCYACYHQMLRELRTPKPPAYLLKAVEAAAKPPAKAGKKSRRKPVVRVEDEGPSVRPAR